EGAGDPQLFSDSSNRRSDRIGSARALSAEKRRGHGGAAGSERQRPRDVEAVAYSAVGDGDEPGPRAPGDRGGGGNSPLAKRRAGIAGAFAQELDRDPARSSGAARLHHPHPRVEEPP